MIDERLTLHTYEGQRPAVQDLFIKFLGEKLDSDSVKTCVALIREARMIVQAENDDKRKTIANDAATSSQMTSALPPNGPFPKLLGNK